MLVGVLGGLRVVFGVGIGNGVVGVLCGAHALALVAHVPFLCLLRLREVLMHVCDGDEGPGEVVTISNAFEPSGFG